MYSTIDRRIHATFGKPTFTESRENGKVPKAETFESFLELFGARRRTLREYIKIVRQFERKHKEITQDNVTKFLRKDEHQHPPYFSAMKYYLAFKDVQNVFIPILKSKPHEPTESPTRHELREIYQKIPEKYKDAILLFRFLDVRGTRINEALGATLNDADREKKTIKLLTKGGYIHYVKVPEPLFSDILNNAQEEGRFGNDRLFFGQCKNTESAYADLRWILEHQCGIPLVVVRKIMQTHNFRRGVVNEIVDKTGNIAAASAYVGHNRIETTMRYVSKQTREKLKEEGLKAMTEN